MLEHDRFVMFKNSAFLYMIGFSCIEKMKI